MKPILRNIIVVIGGIIVGSVVNMGLINLNGVIIPLPEGADISTYESLKESMQLFKPINFLFPFLAHALGTLAGAFLAVKLAAGRKLILAMIIGVLFLIGGTLNIWMIGGPAWFYIVDLSIAYIPMAWIAYKLGTK